jgi:hypothetical protein
MNTVAELEKPVPKLSGGELEAFRRWFEEYLEDRRDLRDEVVAALDQSRAEIAAGDYRTRQP